MYRKRVKLNRYSFVLDSFDLIVSLSLPIAQLIQRDQEMFAACFIIILVARYNVYLDCCV